MPTRTSTARSRPLPSSSTAELWEALAAGAAAESPLWGAALRSEPERLPVFSALAPERFALAVETIYEGYLVHYGRPRLFDPPGPDEAILLGDYLYAHGLVRIADSGELDAVAALADLISACAHLRAEGAPGDGDAWVETCVRLGGDASTAAGALAAHADRFG
jgi:hypothetical protein